MIKPIRYEYPIDDFHAETWTYWFMDRDMRLVLDEYKLEERATKRHKWKVVAEWDRMRNSWHPHQMKREEIPQREDVRAEVLRQFIERITIE